MFYGIAHQLFMLEKEKEGKKKRKNAKKWSKIEKFRLAAGYCFTF
jgi:hypothetical protein